MTAFALKQTTKQGREDCYHYEAEDGQKVTFHADTNRAWNWIILEGDKATASAVIEAACEAGFQPARMAVLTIPDTKPTRRKR